MDKATAARESLNRLFEACKTNDQAVAATLLLYRGTNQDEHFKRDLNPAHPDELKYLTDMMSRVNEWLAKDPTPTIGETLYSEQSQGEWVAIEVVFEPQHPDPKRRYFGFLFVDGLYRLGDIDR